MLMLVLGDNLLLTFLGWEGVGACSYFLISFWFTEATPTPSAGKKAFVTNRVGDWGFMVAMFLTFARGRHAQLRRASSPAPPSLATDHGHGHRRCCCSSAPSASRPSSRCYVWLPDAMAGPTPCRP